MDIPKRYSCLITVFANCVRPLQLHVMQASVLGVMPLILEYPPNTSESALPCADGKGQREPRPLQTREVPCISCLLVGVACGVDQP